VTDIDEAETQVNDKVESLGGYITQYNRNDYDGEDTRIYITAKVPAEALEEMQGYLEEIGVVDRAEMYTEDITDQYYDIESRLKHALVQEEKYLALLEAAESTEDVLMIMEELDAVQERIEQFKGKIKMWDGLVDFSEINITIYPETAMINNENDNGRWITGNEVVKGTINGVKAGTRFVVNMFGYLVIALGYLLLPAIIIILLITLIRMYRKNHPKKEKKEKKGKQIKKLTEPLNTDSQGDKTNEQKKN
jgi:hypothetical protein